MATKQITTWAEFKTALTENITEDTNYEIMNDIDASNITIDSMINIPTSPYIRTYNGNNHKINGITSYSSINGVIGHNAFTSSSTSGYDVIFNNIHFSNMQLSDTSGFLIYCGSRGGTSSRVMQVNNCMFNGQVYRLQNNYTGSYRNSIHYNGCSFNVDIINPIPSGAVSAQFNNCYMILNYKRPRTSSDSTTYMIEYLNNCYIGGSLKVTGSVASPGVRIIEYAGNSVINMDIDITATSNYVAVVAGYYSDKYLLVNNDKITTAGATVYLPNNSYKLTDAQIKSKTYIQDNTLFPLNG